MRYEISEETLQDVINIEVGLFNPLKGFMNAQDYRSVVEHMTLSDGTVWTIPITLDVEEEKLNTMMGLKEVILTFHEKEVATLHIEDFYRIDNDDIAKIYKTTDRNHPGVYQECLRSPYRVGGHLEIRDKTILEGALSPVTTKAHFESHGWKTIVGFQTRNVIHRAHEYLQRVGLELCDALFINPLVGWKKKGDFSEVAIENGYKKMIEVYYENLNIYFATLKTPMRYAGPREAIFHAIIRKNLGCTHFIIGRDHAGVGAYYGTYEAHELAKEILKKGDLGIALLLLKEPFYCHVCEQIVSESCCGHSQIEKISGTKIREMLTKGMVPPSIYMRKEVAEEIIKLKERMFIV